MNNRGLGSVYQPTYIDKASGEKKISAVWWVRYHHRGRKYRESSGSTNRNVALKMLKDRNGKAVQGKPFGSQLERTSFEDLAQMLIKDYEANGRRSLRRIKGALLHLRGFFGEMRAVDMTADMVTSYIAARQTEDAKPATINRELAALKRSFSLAEHAGKVAQRPRIAMLQENNVRTGFFEPEQFASVLKRLPDYLQPIIRTAYICGWRVPSELLTRHKHHVDLDAGWLRLDSGETKNGEGRMFPLRDKDGNPTELHGILEEQLERTRTIEVEMGRVIPWLFHRNGNPIKDFRKTWQMACMAADIPGRLTHDFRRTAVRNLERAGVPRSAAMKMTGHKTEAVYRRYAIVDEAMLREGAAKLATLHAFDRHAERKVIAIAETKKL